MTTETLPRTKRSVGCVPPTGPYKTVAVPPSDIAIILESLESLFDQVVAAGDKHNQLDRIRDVHDFFKRTFEA